MGFGLYIHIPFCMQKCHYCDFTSFPYPGDSGAREYVRAVEREMRLRCVESRSSRVSSVYIGGGTPTVLPPELLLRIGKAAAAFFSVSKNAEITVEANPGTLTHEMFGVFGDMGVNRISVGAQSFNDDLLRAMGRVHNSRAVEEIVHAARGWGIENIGIDLIYGLPGQTCSEWEQTLRRAVKLKPAHISTYGLAVEKGTPWGNEHSRGNLVLPGEGECCSMYDLSRELLVQNGYNHYEISNFALPGFFCRHNLVYWRRQEYIGIGLGASSFVSGLRVKNTADIDDYKSSLECGRLPLGEMERPSLREAMAEYVFLGLRTSEGVSASKFSQEFGIDMDVVYKREIRMLLDRGLVLWDGDRLSLEPSAYIISNEIFLHFMP